MRSVRWGTAAVIAAAAAYVLSLLPGVRESVGTTAFWDVGVYVFVFACSATVCVIRAFAVPADRAAWACIGAGLFCYAVGTLVYQAQSQAGMDIPYPSVSDGLWLLLYPASIAGLWLLARRRLAGSVRSMWLDGLISASGLTSVSAAFVFPRITEAASGTPAAVVTNFAYPLLDLALVATVIGSMAALGAWNDRTWLLLGAGFLTFAVADSWYLVQLADDIYAAGSPVDGLYLVAVAVLAAAASPRVVQSEDDDPLEQRSFLIPGGFAFLAMAVLVVGAMDDTATPNLAVALAVLSLAAAGARTAIAVREVVRLADSRKQALTDALTGLPNRRAFYELAGRVEADGAGPDQESMILIIDLDRFKEINDALGHQIGDRVLRAVCDRLAHRVPAGATISRLGGDEMAVCMPLGGTRTAIDLAERLVEAMALPFMVGDLSLHLSASIGITAFTPGLDIGQALAQADVAMYRAKASRAGWEIYDQRRDGDAWNRLAMVEALRETLVTGGLTVEFQPIVAGSTLRPVEVEALVRWNHPVHGAVAPDTFLPLAEQAGLMPVLTKTVMGLALDQVRALRAAGRNIRVAVNLSASDLLNANLIDFIQGELVQRDLPGSVLRLEITESLLVEDMVGADALLVQLRLLGIELAVDDYGTGFSSLSYLHDLPVSTLKIDQSFTARLLSDARTGIIVGSTIEMAHRLGLTVVAEGVETSAQLDWLAARGCDYLQGFHIGRPAPADQLQGWLADWEQRLTIEDPADVRVPPSPRQS